ncbi:MAG: prolyl aminopeptidase [Methylophaga sp.]|nr:prolyl aminopeptidase [Methylophaga sp.]
MRTLYPEIEPYQTHEFAHEMLSDGRQHRVYVEECGNPDGIPVIFLHGGPGSGCRPQHRSYFNPEKYRIVLFDQRGCGRSTPTGELENNTTDYLVADMEHIREALGIEKWQLFGGSWGATLALCYAREYPQHVSSMILRGTFLGRAQDVDWVYAEGGASRLFPENWQQLVADLSESEKPRPLRAYFDKLTDEDEAVQLAAAQTLNAWEGTIVMLRDHEFVPDLTQAPGPLAHSRIQLHYAMNHCFIDDRPILDSVAQMQDIPTIVIHGRYDLVCPLQQSWELKQAWPKIDLRIVPLAGHAAGEPGLIDALVTASDEMAEVLS